MPGAVPESTSRIEGPRRLLLIADSIAIPLIIALAMLAATSAVQAQAWPPGLSDNPTQKSDSSDYGAGGHRDNATNTQTGTLTGTVYDEAGNARRHEEETFATDNGVKHETEKQVWDFDRGGRLTYGVDYKFGMAGGLKEVDITHYGLHGERTWEQVAEYKPTGYEMKDWKLGHWSSEFSLYKPLTDAKSTPPVESVIADIGMLSRAIMQLVNR